MPTIESLQALTLLQCEAWAGLGAHKADIPGVNWADIPLKHSHAAIFSPIK